MITNHKFILFLILVVTLTLLIINFFIPKNLAIFSGEFLFSFDYISHFQNLLNNYVLNKDQFNYLIQCQQCPSFYHISAWYMLWVFGLLSIGQLLGLHPMIYYLLVTIIVQLVFLYLAVILHFKRFNIFAFLFGSIFFISAPHKYYLIPSATLDGVIHGILLGIFSIWLYLLRGLEIFTYRKIILVSVTLGILFIFSFNITLAHFPLVVYGLLFSTLLFWRKVFSHITKFVVSVFIAGTIPLIVNLPIIISQFKSGNDHTITSFNTHTWQDSLFAGFSGAGGSLPESYLVFGLILFLLFISGLKLYQKVFTIVAYLFISWMMTGLLFFDRHLYQFIFDYFPLMGHMRSLYRLFFYEYVILFFVIYIGLRSFFENKNLVNQFCGFFIGAIFLTINISFIFNHLNFFHISYIPQEYFQTAQYFKNNKDQKIYLPFYGSKLTESMSGNYSWLLPQEFYNQTLYSNPFTSLFYIPNMQSVEGYQLSDIKEAQLRSLLSFNKSELEIRKVIEQLGIKYVIVDKNYLWSENYGDFDLSVFTELLSTTKNFGNLEIYNSKVESCISSFGDFHLGYCAESENPKVFVNKTAKDYALHLFTNDVQYLMRKNEKVKVNNFIVNPPVRNYIIEKNIYITESFFQLDIKVDGLYRKIIPKGKYKLFVPILKISPEERLFRELQLNVKLDDTIVTTISPYSKDEKYTWVEIPITIVNESELSINTEGVGFVIMGDPLLIRESDFELFERTIDRYKDIPVVNR